MARPITIKALRGAHDEAQVAPRLGVRVIAAFVVLQLLLIAALLMLFPARAAAAPAKSDLSVSSQNGYVRLVFTLAEETEADVRLANGILVVAFKRPVDVPVDRIPMQAAGYVNAARADPDGLAVRLALGRKVTVNTMAAGEKLFVDLLPEGWSGLPPGLPQEVVEELARRAREAEKKARAQQQVAQQRVLPPVRVRVGVQPTFTRYTFGLPALIAVSVDRNDDKMTMTFEAPLRFDLADVRAALPSTIAGVDAQSRGDSASVQFDFVGKVDIRTFREDNNFIVDVQPIRPREGAVDPAAQVAALAAAAAKTEPAAPEQPAKPVQAAAAPPAKPAADLAAPAPAAAEPPQSAEKPSPPATVAAREAEDAKPASDASAPVVADVRRHGDALRITFPFAQPTPAAVFRRADTIWLVFDNAGPIDIGKIAAASGSGIRAATVTRSNGGQVVQLKLERPKLTSAGTEGNAWTVIVGDMMLEPTQPLSTVRLVQAGGRASVTIPFNDPRQLHRLADADVGDTLLVVTALGPARGFLKAQEYVEFNALVSTHGVALQPLADDVAAELGPDKIVVTRPGGLVLSSAGARASPAVPGAEGARRAVGGLFTLDPQAWGFDREADFRDRQMHLIAAAAAAEDARRMPAQLELARFYLARDLTAEAKGVLDVAALDERATHDGTAAVLRAVANIMLGRGSDALKDLSSGPAAKRNDIALWRALAQAREGKWVEAREGFRTLDTATATLPLEMQRFAFQEAVRAAVEVRDFGAAASLLSEFETMGSAHEREADLMVLKGRVMEGLGRLAEALTFYRAAAASADRPAAVRGQLREIALRQQIGDMKRDEATAALESLTTAWRGDATEAEALQLLGRMYAEDGRYRDAFQVMRTALTAYPHSEMTRRIQDEAAVAFEALFLGGKGDAMPPIDALSLFYDFRDLTPVGRRGDEMIRKLADRLVSVDLLDQAAEVLQHQVDNRLQGAARAQVAVKLAVIYLMARKPDRAIQALRTSRSADLPNELRNQRLLIEARAQSDVGRPELALEVIANLQGREVERLRADVLWKARRWRDAGEQIEKLYGERWRDFAPLSEAERADVMRAAIGYALAEDTLGMDRFRTKYMAKMAEGPDRRAFEVVTAPFSSNAPEFADIARVIAAADTLDAFLRDIRAKFPDTTGPAPTPAAAPERGASAGAGRAG
ncbi:MAG TPA: tetratricopeptide repeat protein [Xanthobacteraceae bacterium]|nr:tetratricopeptide repeat protein [Xanthobacteraceae bacterium]